jgi:4-amino-4-deoxy-L-arabinose transferase-like glycosyltransferase
MVEPNLWDYKSGLDSTFYKTWAEQIVHGDILGTRYYVLNPGYAYFIALVYKVFGVNPVNIIISQFVLGSIICVLVFYLGLFLFNKQTGLISSGLFCFYGYSYFTEGLILSSTLITVSLILFVLFLIKAQKTASWYYWLVSGLFLGLAVLGRGNNLVFVPVILLWMLFDKRILSINKKLGWFVVGLFLILFPVTLRNYIVNKEFVLTTVHGGLNFYKGNNKNSPGCFYIEPFESPNPVLQTKSYQTEAVRRTNQDLSLAQSSNYWFKQGKKFIVKSPVDWLQLTVKKVIMLLNNREIPLNYDYDLFRTRINFLKITWLTFGLMLSLSIVGLILNIKKKSLSISITTYCIIIYFFSIIMFFVCGEYRYPMVPLLIPFAGFTITETYRFVKTGTYGKVVFVTCLLLITYLLTNHDFYPAKFNNKTANVQPDNIELKIVDGRQRLAAKNYVRAAELFNQVLVTQPKNKGVYNDLGITYCNLGDYKKAKSCFESALKIDPGYKTARQNYLKLCAIKHD